MRAEGSPPLIVADVRGRYAARPPLVVDCSVIAAVLFDEPNRDSAAQALFGKELFAPELLSDESDVRRAPWCRGSPASQRHLTRVSGGRA